MKENKPTHTPVPPLEFATRMISKRLKMAQENLSYQKKNRQSLPSSQKVGSVRVGIAVEAEELDEAIANSKAQIKAWTAALSSLTTAPELLAAAVKLNLELWKAQWMNAPQAVVDAGLELRAAIAKSQEE